MKNSKKKVSIRYNFLPYSWCFLLVASLFMASCLPEPLEVKDLPTVKPEIVVASQIIPNQSLVVLLTRTFSALDASEDSDPEEVLEQIAVNDAVVTLSGPQGLYSLEQIDNGVYGGTFIPFEEGATYTLNVESASLGEVHATTTVQRTVPFDEISAELYYNGFGDTLAQITYALTDPLETNHYMITVQEVEQEDAVRNILNPGAYTRIYDDTGINGEQFGEQFRVFPRDYAPGDTIAVSLSNISQEYFEFMQLRIDNRITFIEFLSEPVNYPSNVVGGKGFFNLYVPDTRVFVFEQPGEE